MRKQRGLTLTDVLLMIVVLLLAGIFVLLLTSLRRMPGPSARALGTATAPAKPAPRKTEVLEPGEPEEDDLTRPPTPPVKPHPDFLAALTRAREEAKRIRCRNNLNQIAKGMATYLNEFGDNRFYPCPLGRGRNPKDYNGAEWLASLYWTGVVPDPGVFICPSSGDTNAKGKHIGATRISALFGSQTVSYAGMHWRSLTDRSGKAVGMAIRDDFPPNEAMGSDDTQGTINHGTATNGGMSVLFFDSHVEFKTNREIDLKRGVGAGRTARLKGLLWRLRN